MTEFTGEIHPLCLMCPRLGEDDLASLASSIADSGQREPITLDQHGRLIDGKNRLAACELADVAPSFTVVEFPDEAAIAGFIADRNAERVHLSPGRQAMERGLLLRAAGKRRNGRWERDSLDIGESHNRWAQYDRMKKVGVVLDVADRAAAHGPDWDGWQTLPQQVLDGGISLDYAYKTAGDFDTRAALAEAMKTQPLTETLTSIDVALDTLAADIPPPQLEVPLTKQHRDQITTAAKRLRELATHLTTYAKEHK